MDSDFLLCALCLIVFMIFKSTGGKAHQIEVGFYVEREPQIFKKQNSYRPFVKTSKAFQSSATFVL